MTLVSRIYEISQLLPSEEKYGLTSQIRRSAVSIPSNIAEGCSRQSNKEFNRFLEIAIGSAFELETQLLIAQKQNMIDSPDLDSVLDELNQIQKMTNSLRTKLKPNS